MKKKCSDLKFLEKIGGMTNDNYHIECNSRSYILRIPGEGTQYMINRKHEYYNSELAFKLGLCDDIVYFDKENGVKISRLINKKDINLNSEKDLDKVLECMYKLHSSKECFKNDFLYWNMIESYEEMCKKNHTNMYSSYNYTKEVIYSMWCKINKLNIKQVCCHNDLVIENFIKDEKNRIHLIDWEYSGMNDQAWDIACLSLENSLSIDIERYIVEKYRFQESRYLEERIFFSKLFQDFLWSVWTIAKKSQGIDFGDYGIERYERLLNDINKVDFM
ncbi:choline kinase family protein [Clostridium sp.]|uniref:choline kinase family protein n=2 Tax=Clostridium sp. TaxID=1506 RepID=UPI002FCB4E1A